LLVDEHAIKIFRLLWSKSGNAAILIEFCSQNRTLPSETLPPRRFAMQACDFKLSLNYLQSL
jgi:hypothetical protein